MTNDFHIIIPARYNSSRLPGKLLMPLHGKPVLEHTYTQALKAHPQTITIATDNTLILELAEKLGAMAIMTSTSHNSGTDRLAEVVSKQSYKPDDIIVNVQGDEPFIDPALIQQVAASLNETSAPVATLCWPVDTIDNCHNPHIVKVVRNAKNEALYFSRSAIPFHRDTPNDVSHMFRHIGLYAYRASFLQSFVKWPVCPLEAAESLEQLRILWHGYKIKVETACVSPLQDINTSRDLQLANSIRSG